MVRAAPLIALAFATALGGCDFDMRVQPKFKAQAPATLWADGSSERPLPKGVVAQGDLPRDDAARNPPPVTEALLARGRERYNVYCAPCHGLSGDADGIVVQHGFPAPPSYHSDALMKAPASTFYDTITNGYGVMYSYGARVAPADRWAIVAYIRALQLSRHARVADVPDAKEHLP
ncbi:MAG: c-type cytochrome [Pseudolabrys sp.]